MLFVGVNMELEEKEHVIAPKTANILTLLTVYGTITCRTRIPHDTGVRKWEKERAFRRVLGESNGVTIEPRGWISLQVQYSHIVTKHRENYESFKRLKQHLFRCLNTKKIF